MDKIQQTGEIMEKIIGSEEEFLKFREKEDTMKVNDTKIYLLKEFFKDLDLGEMEQVYSHTIKINGINYE